VTYDDRVPCERCEGGITWDDNDVGDRREMPCGECDGSGWLDLPEWYYAEMRALRDAQEGPGLPDGV